VWPPPPGFTDELPDVGGSRRSPDVDKAGNLRKALARYTLTGVVGDGRARVVVGDPRTVRACVHARLSDPGATFRVGGSGRSRQGGRARAREGQAGYAVASGI